MRCDSIAINEGLVLNGIRPFLWVHPISARE